MSGVPISEFLSWALMAQALLTQLWGYVADYFLAADMMLLMLALTILNYVFVLIPSPITQYAAAIVYVVCNSHIYNVRYMMCRSKHCPLPMI